MCRIEQGRFRGTGRCRDLISAPPALTVQGIPPRTGRLGRCFGKDQSAYSNFVERSEITVCYPLDSIFISLSPSSPQLIKHHQVTNEEMNREMEMGLLAPRSNRHKPLFFRRSGFSPPRRTSFPGSLWSPSPECVGRLPSGFSPTRCGIRPGILSLRSRSSYSRGCSPGL